MVHYVQLGSTPSADQSATWVGNVNEQVAKVCDELATHPILSTAPAIDAVGFSQGGQFLRAYVERCNSPPVRNLVTFGSQHSGIIEFRTCARGDLLCSGAMWLLRAGVWTQAVQSRLVPAQYFRDPAELDKYLEHSNFLADINNERVLKNETYGTNLAKLQNMVLYMFDNDTTSVPKESAWFGEVKGEEVVPLRSRVLYEEDWIGLKALDKKGGLHFRSARGEHMELTEELLNKTFGEFFGPWKKSDGDAARPVRWEMLSSEISEGARWRQRGISTRMLTSWRECTRERAVRQEP